MKAYIAFCGLAVMMTGCALPGGSPSGSQPSEKPPQLVAENDAFVWNYPSRFGPVPAELQELGDANCQDIGYDHATGYHPEARNGDGVTMPGGGFFCVQEEKQQE